MTPISNAISAEVLSLPDSAFTRSNYGFCPQDDYWRIKDCTHQHLFNFADFHSLCSEEMIHSCKKVSAWYLKNRSVSHASNMFKQFKWFAEAVQRPDALLTSIESHHILSYEGNLPNEREYYLGALSGFLSKWHLLGYPGIAADAYAFVFSAAEPDVALVQGGEPHLGEDGPDPVLEHGEVRFRLSEHYGLLVLLYLDPIRLFVIGQKSLIDGFGYEAAGP
jgi:hypothetical protein